MRKEELYDSPTALNSSLTPGHSKDAVCSSSCFYARLTAPVASRGKQTTCKKTSPSFLGKEDAAVTACPLSLLDSATFSITYCHRPTPLLLCHFLTCACSAAQLEHPSVPSWPFCCDAFQPAPALLYWVLRLSPQVSGHNGTSPGFRRIGSD